MQSSAICRLRRSSNCPNTSMSAKHSHNMFMLSRGDMVKHEVGACACACACVHVRAVCVCSESMNDVTDNAKNYFGDPLDAKYIACARSENVGLLLRNSYVVSYKFELVLFLGNAFVPR